MDRNKIKEEIRSSMKGYLGSKYPNGVTPDQIINELTGIYQMLESKGLLADLQKQGFNFKAFQHFALTAKRQREVQDSLEKMFGFGGRR